MKSLFLILGLLVLTLPLTLRADKIAQLKQLQIEKNAQMEELEGRGLGPSHPRVLQLKKQLDQLQIDLDEARDLMRETIILLEGKKSFYLKGHPRFDLTEQALDELLKAGWKIKQIIPAGTTNGIKPEELNAAKLKAAYVWMSYEP